MQRIGIDGLILFPKYDNERTAYQEHKPHAVHPRKFGEEEFQAEGKDERSQCRCQRPVCRCPLIEETGQEYRQGTRADKPRNSWI